MSYSYVGVDIAGSKNTWVACLVQRAGRATLEQPPLQLALSEIMRLADERDVAAVAIDAQLSVAISDENGFRSSDRELKQSLPPRFRTWVASFNSLMAVPIRARLLAEALSPSVATILETHPRACLYFATPAILDSSVDAYKKGIDAGAHVEKLWEAWCAEFGVSGSLGIPSDGALDAAICATVAYLSHHRPEALRRLRHTANDKTGRGPFVIVTPKFHKGSQSDER